MQIKTTRHHYTSIKAVTIPPAGEDAKELRLSHIAGGSVKW